MGNGEWGRSHVERVNIPGQIMILDTCMIQNLPIEEPLRIIRIHLERLSLSHVNELLASEACESR